MAQTPRHDDSAPEMGSLRHMLEKLIRLAIFLICFCIGWMIAATIILGIFDVNPSTIHLIQLKAPALVLGWLIYLRLPKYRINEKAASPTFDEHVHDQKAKITTLKARVAPYAANAENAARKARDAIRRAANAGPSENTGTRAPPGEPHEKDISTRLATLKALFEQDLINEQEYEERKSKLLDEL